LAVNFFRSKGKYPSQQDPRINPRTYRPAGALTLFPDLTKELFGGQQIGEYRIVYPYTFVAIA
jgi:hypothetical protein